MLCFCRKGDVSDDLFCFTIICNCPRIPVCYGNTGNRYLVLTHGELIGIALAGYESSRDGGERFCCFAFSICYFKREEGSGGAWGRAWIDKGIELIIAVLIRFHTTDAEAVDCSILRILVVEASNLYNHSRHHAIHDESKLISLVGIALLTSIRHEVGGSKRF